MPGRRAPRFAAAAAVVALTLSVAACAPEASVAIELPAQVEATLGDEVTAQLQTAMETAIAASGATGAIVDVRAPWSGTWTQAFGTSTADGAKVTTEMPFKVGMVTRLMTCDVLYAMADADKVNLDDSVTRWLNGYPAAENMTLGQLCDGSSGLKSYSSELSDRWFANPPRDWNPRELAAYGYAQGVAFQPGTAFRDSDTGYVLLGLALERASGLSAAELYQKYVFEPIGMTSSSLPAKAQTDGSWLAGLWSPNGEDGKVSCDTWQDVTALSPSAGYTAAGVVSTVDDLSRYIQSVATSARSYDTENRFAEPFSLGDKQPSWYTATGGAYQAGSLVGQFGGVPGYLVAAFADTETGMSVVVVLNDSRASSNLVRSLAWQLAAIASKAPAASGQTAPEAGLPWEAATYAKAVEDTAICALP